MLEGSVSAESLLRGSHATFLAPPRGGRGKAL